MITYGEPPRYVRFRVDRHSPHYPIPRFEDERLFKPVFPHAVWIEFPECGVCLAGKPVYRVVISSVWKGRLAARPNASAEEVQGDIDRHMPSGNGVRMCECMGEILESDE